MINYQIRDDSPIKYFDRPNIKDVEIGYKYYYPQE